MIVDVPSATDHGVYRGGDVACARHRRGDRCVSMAQIMEFSAEVTQLFVEQIVVCQCHRSADFRRAADHGGNHAGDSAGDNVVDILVLCNDKCLGKTEQKTVEGSAVAALVGVCPVLGQGVLHARWCATTGSCRDSAEICGGPQLQFIDKVAELS